MPMVPLREYRSPRAPLKGYRDIIRAIFKGFFKAFLSLFGWTPLQKQRKSQESQGWLGNSYCTQGGGVIWVQ